MALAKRKEVNGKPGKINELIQKTKADLKERPDNIILIIGLCFLLIDWLSFGERDRDEARSKLDVQGQGVEEFRWKNEECSWTRGVGDLENWTIFMDVMCVSSLIAAEILDLHLLLSSR